MKYTQWTGDLEGNIPDIGHVNPGKVLRVDSDVKAEALGRYSASLTDLTDEEGERLFAEQEAAPPPVEVPSFLPDRDPAQLAEVAAVNIADEAPAAAPDTVSPDAAPATTDVGPSAQPQPAPDPATEPQPAEPDKEPT